ncbi:4-(cytidine 5'-diphospho)-2-C-methyl-D-erythritol kinase [Evansella cellulosilytica]|uniref:4-diphosphocytidyl-2-C-methyl-D-erythritol kinase n=1 Tax=Evansella cellulosilytica (strain ATCC 21833 / DSM 2522 / FERM P-1141 / JCM 9156 / N-4) TaxID=649639 RepID=E6TRP4_EVAC2|nr:4-(cytidine 5'-diphospho)-2-C-methyl-D-erythritol kinase [Evansella cellulosilytica]ADU28338.1 4-diphosphocytidyl-2C-methyl-D-erythritol kinase [Evansella cellulosilytica DSM 2522]
MHTHKIIKAPAKINLTLDVIRKRDDGYHDVEMVMTTVDLADRIELTTLEENRIKVDVNHGFVPSDNKNLAYQAAKLLKDKMDVKKGVRIFIDKQIPISAGLAGGSTDAAAVLRGLNELWDLNLSIDELAELGLEIGSDVPFCVHGGTALATGRGETLQFLPTPPPCWVILVKPPMGVSTKEIYQRLNLDQMEHPDTQGMIASINNGDFSGICSRLENVMEKVTFELYKDVERVKNSMIQFGADGVVMSGSGPTVFALTQNETRADRLYNSLKGFMDQVFVVRLLGTKHD